MINENFEQPDGHEKVAGQRRRASAPGDYGTLVAPLDVRPSALGSPPLSMMMRRSAQRLQTCAQHLG